MDSQDISSPTLKFSRVFSIQSFNSSSDKFFDKSFNQLKQANSPPKKKKLDAILNTLRAYKNSQSTTDLHEPYRVSQKFSEANHQTYSKEDQSFQLSKKESQKINDSNDTSKKTFCIKTPSKKYFQSHKKEENSSSHSIKQPASQNLLKRAKQSQIIFTKNHDFSGHTNSAKNLLIQKSLSKNFSIQLQKSSLQAIKEKLQKYGINTSHNVKHQNYQNSNSKALLNKSQKYPQSNNGGKNFQEMRLASSGQLSPTLIRGIQDRLRQDKNQYQSGSNQMLKLKKKNQAVLQKYGTLTQPKSTLGSVKGSIIEKEWRNTPEKNTETNSVNSNTIHSKRFNLNIQNFAGMKFKVTQTIGPKKSGSFGNYFCKQHEDEQVENAKQKPGSCENKKTFAFKSNLELPISQQKISTLKSSEKHDQDLKETIQTNYTIQKLERKLCFKDFILGRQIGKGKFGRVYICTHHYTGFVSAMKIIKKDLIRKQRSIEQLTRQIKIQMFLNHSNSVKMYGFFDDSQNIYLLMEYCVDGQLYSLLKLKKRFEQDEAIPIIRDICEGLSHLHEKNIIHRDVKPQNVVISFGLSKLCDFGWSVNSQNQKRETFCGTPLYVSPELLMGKTYDYKVDIWALGIMVYELLTGRLPFQITNEKELKKIVTSEVKYPEHLSEDGRNFIQHLLQKNPSYRNDIESILRHKFLEQGQVGEKNKLR